MRIFHRVRERTILSLLLFAAPGPLSGAFAEESPPLLSPVEDWRIEARVRQAIRDHSELTRFNPGVTVQDGNASLFGILPTKKAHEELLQTVKAVRGVNRVETRIRIVPPPDTLPDRIADAVLFGKPLTGIDARPTPDEKTAIVRDRPRTQTPAETMSSPSRTAMKPDLGKTVDLDEYLRKTSRDDLRYRQVTWVIQDGVVKLRGKVQFMQDAWDLAERLADLPGVKRVLLDGIGTK